MKWLFLLTLLSQAYAQAPQSKTVDQINGLNWDGSSYKVELNNFQKPIVISGSNEVVPCLENAYKSKMQVLLEIDSDIPMIKSCALYTPGLIKVPMQAQEEPAAEKAPATPSVPKR